MKANKLFSVGCLVSKFSLACLSFAFCANSVFAQEGSKLYFEDKALVVNEEATLPLVLDNQGAPVVALEMELVLPKFVKLSDERNPRNSIVPNEKRLRLSGLNKHKVYFDAIETSNTNVNTYRLYILATNSDFGIQDAAPGESAKLLDLKLKADFNALPGKLTENVKIHLNNVKVSDPSGNPVSNLLPEGYEQTQTMSHQLTFSAAHMSSTQAELPVFVSETSSASAGTVDIVLDNKIMLSGFQCNIAMPEGVNLDPVEPFFLSNRIANHDFSYYVDKAKHEVRVTCSSLDAFEIANVEKSSLFSLNVVAGPNFKGESADIVLKDFVFSSNAAEFSLPCGDQLTVKINNLASKLEGNYDLDKKEVANAVWVDNDYIAEDVADFKARKSALGNGYAAVVAEPAAVGILDEIATLNAEANQLRSDIKSFRAVPGFIVSDPNAANAKVTSRDLSKLVGYLLGETVLTPDGDLVSKRLYKRVDVDGNSALDSRDIKAIVDLIMMESK